MGSAVVVAFLAFMAFMAAAAARRHKADAKRWNDALSDDMEDGVLESGELAKDAIRQADMAHNRAVEARLKAEKRLTEIGKRDDEMADIVDNWRKSGGL